MQRSSSNSRVSDELFKHTKNTNSDTDTDTNQQQHHHHHQQQLPTYDPLSYVAKKERSRLQTAENAIHLIPLVLLLCAIILWFFSNPELRVKNQ